MLRALWPEFQAFAPLVFHAENEIHPCVVLYQLQGSLSQVNVNEITIVGICQGMLQR